VPNAIAPDGATIAYEVAGDGRPLVLVHGITESCRSWDPLIAPLARDHRVVAVDLRGHGESERRPPYDALTMAADVHAVVESVGAPQPLVVGHSLGGAVISMYAATNPVRGAINVDQTLELRAFQELLTALAPMLRGDDATFQATMQQMFESLDGALPSDELARLTRIRRPEQPVVLGVWDFILNTSADELDELVANTASMITAPYLALHGSEPGETYARWLKSTMPTVTLEVWRELGHYPHLVEPGRFLERVNDFAS